MEVNGINKVFVKRLRQKMDQNSMTQMQLARLTGLEQNKISRVLNHKSRLILQDYVICMERLDPLFATKMREIFGEDYNQALREYILCQRSVARMVHNLLNHRHGSNWFCPTLFQLQTIQRFITKLISKDGWMSSVLYLLNGVGSQIAKFKNDITFVGHFQLQSPVAC